jgi:hypothetical protein
LLFQGEHSERIAIKIPKVAFPVEGLPKNVIGKVTKPALKALMEGKNV